MILQASLLVKGFPFFSSRIQNFFSKLFEETESWQTTLTKEQQKLKEKAGKTQKNHETRGGRGFIEQTTIVCKPCPELLLLSTNARDEYEVQMRPQSHQYSPRYPPDREQSLGKKKKKKRKEKVNPCEDVDSDGDGSELEDDLLVEQEVVDGIEGNEGRGEEGEECGGGEAKGAPGAGGRERGERQRDGEGQPVREEHRRRAGRPARKQSQQHRPRSHAHQRRKIQKRGHPRHQQRNARNTRTRRLHHKE